MKYDSLKFTFLFLFCAGLTGCSQPDVAKNITAEKNKTNIQKVANSYVLYASFKQNQGPASESELAEFVANDPDIERNLNWMGIERSKFAEYFSSEADQQKFVVRWGLKFNPDGTAIPLVFDKVGNDDGVRRVALSDGRILEVESDSEYQKLLDGKISSADAGQAAWEGGGGEGPPEK